MNSQLIDIVAIDDFQLLLMCLYVSSKEKANVCTSCTTERENKLQLETFMSNLKDTKAMHEVCNRCATDTNIQDAPTHMCETFFSSYMSFHFLIAPYILLVWFAFSAS